MSMITFFLIIVEIISMIFHSILDLDMQVWHTFAMNVTLQKHNWIIFLLILEYHIKGRNILAINVNMR